MGGGAYKDKDIFFFGTGFLIVLSFTDSEGGQIRVFGICFKGKWKHGSWPIPWAKQGLIRDMTFLEPFPVVVALILRQSQFANSKLLFHIDNM